MPKHPSKYTRERNRIPSLFRSITRWERKRQADVPPGSAYQGKTELRPDPLSPRERQVLQLIAEGKTTKEVATFLQISVKTAEAHRTRIMTKLNIHETAGLVRYAIRSGLTQA